MVVSSRGSQVQVALNDQHLIDLNLSQSVKKDRPAKGFDSFHDKGKPASYHSMRIKQIERGKLM